MITGGHGGGSSILPLDAGINTAFDSNNLLSAPRVEYERPFYRFEEGERASISKRWRAMRRYGIVGERDALMTSR